jgi:hypothetical protein
MTELAATIEALAQRHREPWYVVREPHDYPDGTSYFTHVYYDARDKSGMLLTVRVASHVTPELAELLCVLHNHTDVIVAALRQAKSN